MNGRVIAGHFLNAVVTTTPIGNGVVVQSGLKWRKLNHEQVAEWEEVPSESTGTLSAVGQAVTGAVLPRFISKGASAAVGAAIDANVRPSHTVRVDWADGKRSLLKLPDQLFAHLEVMLKDRRAAVAPPVPHTSEPAGSGLAPTAQPTVTEQAFSLVSGLLKERKAAPSPESTATEKSDVAEQLMKLASLRDAGVLTEDEFAAKKAELLSRM